MKTLDLTPRLSEKTYGLSSAKNQVFVFDVPGGANKHSVKRAVESQFEVGVLSVNILQQKGKAKRTIAKKGRKVYRGREAASKKAYVTLKVGDSLPFFQAIEEEESKAEATQAKMEKAMEKQEAKEAKKKPAPVKTGAKATPSAQTSDEAAADKRPRGFLRLRGRRGNKEGK